MNSKYLFKNLTVRSAYKAHSIVMRPQSEISPHAIFVEHKNKTGDFIDPEIYPRPDGTVYVCGIGKMGTNCEVDGN